MNMEDFLQRLPGVAAPIQRLTFKAKLTWTAVILVLYFILSDMFVAGIDKTQVMQMQQLAALLGASFGTLMTLGIGPIVTASIILQLLVGSRVINWDLTTQRGKIMFQGTQKLLAFTFAFIEALAYASFGAVRPSPFSIENILFVTLQLAVGGWLVIFMDEVISKWGLGSGVSLFIVAGVSKQILMKGSTMITGLVQGVFQEGASVMAYLPTVIALVSTIAVFALVVYAQAMKVEIPLAWGSLRGFGRNWPLRFIYTSNIPVILTAALLINVQIWARLAAQRGIAWLGTVNAQGQFTGGLAYFLSPPVSDAIAIVALSLILAVVAGLIVAYYVFKQRPLEITAFFGVAGLAAGLYFTQGMPISLIDAARILTYITFFILGSLAFSVFWVNTSGMDARSVAYQIQKSGLQIPGFRRDPRIIEHVLNRYIPPLTILGGAFVGFLAAFADFTHALAGGTSILLAVMIVYQLYEQIAYQHLEDMHPALRKFIERV